MFTGSRSYILRFAVACWVTLRATLRTQPSRDVCLFGSEKGWTAPPGTRASRDICTPARCRGISFAVPIKHVSLPPPPLRGAAVGDVLQLSCATPSALPAGSVVGTSPSCGTIARGCFNVAVVAANVAPLALMLRASPSCDRRPSAAWVTKRAVFQRAAVVPALFHPILHADEAPRDPTVLSSHV